MGMTSAAEANLDARVRPRIRDMRARTSYPSPRSADQPGQQIVPAGGTATLTAVPAAPASAADGPAAEGPAAFKSSTTSTTAAARIEAACTGTAGAATKPGPIHLTRRGRIVVGTLVALGVAATAGVIWLAAAGRAQASSQLTPTARLGSSVLRVVVKPGQTLWGIAAQADPHADPRSIIPQIVELNSLSTTAISPGQVLWIPRG